MWVWVVAFKQEVLVVEVEDALHVGIDFHRGQGTRLTGQLEFGLLDVIQIKMRVTRRVDEVTGTETRHLCHHLEQQRIRGNVERYAQEGVCRALVELQREASLRILSVRIVDIELENGVTWGQRHLVHFSHIPCRDNHATRIGIGLQLIHNILYLVYHASVVVGP